MQIYDYKLFSIIPLDCNFKNDKHLQFFYYLYYLEIDILKEELSKYTQQELQDIYDECISKSKFEENKFKYKILLDSQMSETRLGYQISCEYISNLKDTTKQIICYFIFSWYELEHYYLYRQTEAGTDILKISKLCNTSAKTIPYDFIRLFYRGILIKKSQFIEKMREEDLRYGAEFIIKKNKKKCAKGGIQKGKKYAPIKNWVIGKYQTIRKTDKQSTINKIAHKLTEEIKTHFKAEEISFFPPQNRQNTIRKWISIFEKNNK